VFAPKRILYPTDFSPCSKLAFEIACDMAKQNQSTLTILHVVETLGADNVTYGEAATKLEPESYIQTLTNQIKELVPPADSGIPVEHVVAEGEPAEQIDLFAAKNKIDLIIMGTHGKSGLRRLLTGSVAEQVMRKTPCPMLVVRLPHEKK
jgi:nucleotide-binding universal stress UspA family protein